MRISLGFCLLLGVFGDNSQKSRTGSTDVASLAQITSDLALFARITNGIALQNGLVQKSISTDAAVAELLGIASEKTIGELRAVAFDVMKQQVEGLEAIVETATTAIKEKKGMRVGLREVSRMMERAGELVQGAEAQWPTLSDKDLRGEVRRQGALFSDMRLARIDDALRALLEVSERPSDVVTWQSIRADLMSLGDYLTSDLKEYSEYVTSLQEYASGDVEDLLKTHVDAVVTHPVGQLAEFAQKARGLKRFGDGVEEMKEDVVALKDISQHVDILNTLRTALDATFPIVGELQKRLTTPSISGGLPDGLNDVRRIFSKDLGAKWLKDKVSAGKEWTIVETNMKELKQLAGSLGPIHGHYLELLNVTSKAGIAHYSLLRVSAIIERIDKRMEPWKTRLEDVETELAAIRSCFVNVTGARKNELFAPFEKDLKVWKEVKTDVDELHTRTADLSADASISNFTILKEIGSKIGDDLRANRFRTTEDDAWTAVTAIQSIAGVGEFAEAFRAARLKHRQTRRVFKRIRDASTKLNVSSLQHMQTVFEEPAMIGAMRCLVNDTKNDLSVVRDVLAIGTNLKKLDANREDLSDLKAILTAMEEMTKRIVGIQKTSSRHRRDQNPLLKLNDAMRVSNELAKGVDVLKRVLRVTEKSDAMRTAVKYGDDVDEAIRAIDTPPMVSVWTATTRQRLENILRDVSRVEKSAKSCVGKDLPGIFGFFENATRLDGLALDPHLFADPVATSLATHANPAVREATPTFRELAELPDELDFAASHAVLRRAGRTVVELRAFFDSLFGIDRRPPQKDRGNGSDADGGTMADRLTAAEEEGGMMLYFAALGAVVLLIIVVVVVTVICCRRKKSRGKLNKWETWRHLAFLPEGQRKTHEGTEYTPLHLAVLKKKTDEVKRRIKNGAFVNVHSCGQTIETPLHTAVDTKKAELVELLLGAGADVTALDAKYETPLDRANGDGGSKTMARILKAHEEKLKKKKKKRSNSDGRVAPQELPVEKYKIFIDKSVTGLKEFCKLYKSNIVETVDEATHLVVKVEKDGSWDLEKNEGIAYLSTIFSPKIVMKSSWLNASAEKKADFRDDFKFRVKTITFKGQTYKTMDAIRTHFHEMHVPYLTNAVIHFNQAKLATIDWTTLKETAVAMGATIIDDFPVMQGMLAEQCPYYREDLGHLFIVYMQANAAELEATYPYLRTEKAYTFLDHDEFIDFLLSFKTDHSKLDFVEGESKSKESSGTKSKETAKRSKPSRSQSKETKSKEPGSKEPMRSKEGKSKESKSKEAGSKEAGSKEPMRSKETMRSREGKSKESRSKEAGSRESRSKEAGSRESKSKEGRSKEKARGSKSKE